MAETLHVVGPVQGNAHSLFLCPVCDDDRTTGTEGYELVCTAEFLRGKDLVGDARVGHRSCVCFVTDPFAGEENATDAQRRFYFYRTIALFLNGGGQRVDLPCCVREAIEELYGESRTGFHA